LKCIIERPPTSFAVNIYLFYTSPEATVVHNLDGSVREELMPGESPAGPSATLDEQVLKALVEAGSDALPPSSALARHLDDAIGVRDRLLTLVEGRS